MPTLADRRLLLAVCLLVPALAGCSTLAADEPTAAEHRDEARDRALEWNEDAQLVRIVGVEGSHGEGYAGVDDKPDNGTFWRAALDDGDVGDGRCAVWAYRFVAPDEGSVFQVVVDGDGEIVSATPRGSASQAAPLPEDVIGSDEAVATARDASEGLDRGLDSDGAGLTVQLMHDPEEDAPVWRIAGGGGPGPHGGGMIVLDARTGGVIVPGE
jgi:hypothetical protein